MSPPDEDGGETLRLPGLSKSVEAFDRYRATKARHRVTLAVSISHAERVKNIQAHSRQYPSLRDILMIVRVEGAVPRGISHCSAAVSALQASTMPPFDRAPASDSVLELCLSPVAMRSGFSFMAASTSDRVCHIPRADTVGAYLLGYECECPILSQPMFKYDR